MFEYEFMQRAFWAGGLIGIIAPILGVYLMLRRQVLMADTLSRFSRRVALGSVMNLNPVLSGFAVAIIGALLVEQLRRSYRTYSEVPVAIIWSGFGGGVNEFENESFQNLQFLSVWFHRCGE